LCQGKHQVTNLGLISSLNGLAEEETNITDYILSSSLIMSFTKNFDFIKENLKKQSKKKKSI
jgi:hypothetical protein